MNDDMRPFQQRPAQYKTVMDGLGGLIRIPLDGGLHDGHELYIDEPEVPDEIFTTPRAEPFEWWRAHLVDEMADTAVGGDPQAPPIRYVLEVDAATKEARYVPAPEAD